MLFIIFQMLVSYDGISLYPHPKQSSNNVTKWYIRETYFYLICLPLYKKEKNSG